MASISSILVISGAAPSDWVGFSLAVDIKGSHCSSN